MHRPPPTADPVERLLREWPPALPHDARVDVALSGGRDSIALLDLLDRARERCLPGLALSAVHVHHGLRPAADDWAAFCGSVCARRGIAFRVARVAVARCGGESLEDVARVARYEALAASRADAVALAHHRDDQIETVLLQLLRGAGPRGLAGMPGWKPGRPGWWRPLLGVPRAEIEAYCRARGLAWIDDDSNADAGVRRNLLRLRVMPLLDEGFPGWRDAVARDARVQAEAARLLGELAALDAALASRAEAGARDDERPDALSRPLPTGALRRLPDARAANLLRAWLERQGLRPPTRARLDDWLRQLRGRAGGNLRLAHQSATLGVFRGALHAHAAPSDEFDLTWDGSEVVSLAHGTLRFVPSCGDAAGDVARTGASIRGDALSPGRVRIRPPRGGERIRLADGGRTRKLSTLLQERGIPAWERAALPLVFADGALVCVPGIGVAAGFESQPGSPGWRVDWAPLGVGIVASAPCSHPPSR